MDEASLIQASQHGDLNAFNGLVIAYQEMAYNIAYRLLTDAKAAEDATQTAFISAYRNICSFKGGSFRCWLTQIVKNACYDELRKQKRRPTIPLEPLDSSHEEIENSHWIIDKSLSPEEQVEIGELDHAIQHCINDLPLEFRTVVILIDLNELDYQETAKIMKKPLGTIKSRLARARLRMRDCLQKFWELLPASIRLDHKGLP